MWLVTSSVQHVSESAQHHHRSHSHLLWRNAPDLLSRINSQKHLMHSVLSDMTESFCDGDALKYYSVQGTVMFRTRHTVHCKEIQHISLKMFLFVSIHYCCVDVWSWFIILLQSRRAEDRREHLIHYVVVSHLPWHLCLFLNYFSDNAVSSYVQIYVVLLLS